MAILKEDIAAYRKKLYEAQCQLAELKDPPEDPPEEDTTEAPPLPASSPT